MKDFTLIKKINVVFLIHSNVLLLHVQISIHVTVTLVYALIVAIASMLYEHV